MSTQRHPLDLELIEHVNGFAIGISVRACPEALSPEVAACLLPPRLSDTPVFLAEEVHSALQPAMLRVLRSAREELAASLLILSRQLLQAEFESLSPEFPNVEPRR